VRLRVDIGQALNDVAFWSGAAGHELLVVLDRDTRNGMERQAGVPSESGVASATSGVITIAGRLEPIPYAEAMYSWGLTRQDVQRLAKRGVYVRAYQTVSAAPAVEQPGTSGAPSGETGGNAAPSPDVRSDD
jgi:hypothetical protein